MKWVTISDCELELEEFFGEANTERKDEMIRYVVLAFLMTSLNYSNIFSVMMKTIMI